MDDEYPEFDDFESDDEKERSYPEMNKSNLSDYHYPTNRELRKYQQTIVSRCLFQNTMVCLPTGLGKTLIAAVVMYNYFRWFRKKKIVFLAPTKPLVVQQEKSCYQITGIPISQTVCLTGKIDPKKRKRFWEGKRVFFCTPQVVNNDIASGILKVNDIVLLVFDEAHRASKNYAYCKIVDALFKRNSNCRVLGLSATPGSNLEAMNRLIEKLRIEHISVRTENDSDVKRYMHHKEVTKKIIPLPEEIKDLKDYFEKHIIGPSLDKVKECAPGLFWERNRPDPSKYHKGRISAMRASLLTNHQLNSYSKSIASFNLSKLMSLYSAHHVLCSHTVCGFLNMIENTQKDNKPYMRSAFDEKWNRMKAMAKKLVVGNVKHPKLQELSRILKHHFRNKKMIANHFGRSSETKVIVFAEYRDSVDKMYEVVSKIPTIKPMKFVGQGSKKMAGGVVKKGLTQKQQQDIIRKFKSGNFNVICATCVAEEGLDIGDVDLVVNYDSLGSSVRMIQRMGRTGRKRTGEIVTLLTEGNEVRGYEKQIKKKGLLMRQLRALQENKSNGKLKTIRGKDIFRLKFKPKVKFVRPDVDVDMKSPFRSPSKRSKTLGIPDYELDYLERKYGKFTLKRKKGYFSDRFAKDFKKDKFPESQAYLQSFGTIPHNYLTKMYVYQMKTLTGMGDQSFTSQRSQQTQQSLYDDESSSRRRKSSGIDEIVVNTDDERDDIFGDALNPHFGSSRFQQPDDDNSILDEEIVEGAVTKTLDPVFDGQTSFVDPEFDLLGSILPKECDIEEKPYYSIFEIDEIMKNIEEVNNLTLFRVDGNYDEDNKPNSDVKVKEKLETELKQSSRVSEKIAVDSTQTNVGVGVRNSGINLFNFEKKMEVGEKRNSFVIYDSSKVDRPKISDSVDYKPSKGQDFIFAKPPTIGNFGQQSSKKKQNSNVVRTGVGRFSFDNIPILEGTESVGVFHQSGASSRKIGSERILEKRSSKGNSRRRGLLFQKRRKKRRRSSGKKKKKRKRTDECKLKENPSKRSKF